MLADNASYYFTVVYIMNIEVLYNSTIILKTVFVISFLINPTFFALYTCTSWADALICAQWLPHLPMHLWPVWNSTTCRTNGENSSSPTALCIYHYWLSFVFMLPLSSAVLRFIRNNSCNFFYFGIIKVLSRFPFWHQIHDFFFTVIF